MVNLITDHIDIWTSAQIQKTNGAGRGNHSANNSLHGIKKLRELILELAVQGKLVSQDPNDEPASILLEKIAIEKDRLIKEGKIKKQEPPPEITEDEKPFYVPNTWAWARLQGVSTYIQRGKGPEYADQGKVKVISQKCIQWTGFDLSQARFIDNSSINAYQPERFLQTNDLLWNSTGTGTVGRINVLNDVKPKTLVADSHVTVIRPLKVNSNFLWCYVAAPGIQLRIEPENEYSLVTGTTNQVELNTSAVQPLLVPIPPLAEQHRIVAKVDELMAICDQLEQQQNDSNAAHKTLVETLLTTLTNAANQDEFIESWQRIAENFNTLFTTEQSIDYLKQTILQLAVMGKLVPQDPNDEPASVLLKKIAAEKARLIKEGKLRRQEPLPEICEDEKSIELPVGWVWTRIEACAERITDGEHLSPEKATEGVMLLTAKHVLDNGVSIADPQYVSSDDAKKIRLRCDPELGDVLICSRGTIGRCCVVNVTDYFCLMGSVILVKTLKKEVDPYYLNIYLKSSTGQLFIRGITKGMAVHALYLKDIKLSPLPLPPIAEQRRIVAKVNELMALCDTIKVRINDAQKTQIQLADAIVEQAVA